MNPAPPVTRILCGKNITDDPRKMKLEEKEAF
jgi:hypothetical protein